MTLNPFKIYKNHKIKKVKNALLVLAITMVAEVGRAQFNLILAQPANDDNKLNKEKALTGVVINQVGAIANILTEFEKGEGLWKSKP